MTTIDTDLQLKRKLAFTSIIMDEPFKNLVYSQIIYAQGNIAAFHLSQLQSYEMYHEPLRKYFIRVYNKKPTQTDNLAFVLLLTYPKEIIERFTSFKDLKLAFNGENEESDFESYDFRIDEDMETTCICNEPIMYIHIFRNKYTGIFINIGSECNKRYGLINVNDPTYKSINKKITEAKERIKEKEEGKPEGYYKAERERQKLEKERKKEEKEMEKELKKELKELKKSNKHDVHIIQSCIFCEKKCIYNRRTSKICICSLCVPEKIKVFKKNNNFGLLKSLSNEYVYYLDNCLSCGDDFISKNNSDLCNICIKEWIVKKCKFRGCSAQFCIGKNYKDDYCPDCDEKIINCITCDIKIYKEKAIKQSERCDVCYSRFIKKLIVITCRDCEEDFEVPEKDNYRNYCSGCFKNNLSPHKCISCTNTFNKLPDETWKKTCRDCYYKGK
jgi:hypothetical protein